MKTLYRHGAVWTADGGGVYFWLDDEQVFVRTVTSERYKIVEIKSEDEVVVE